MRVNRKSKQIIRDLLACKVAGMCERDKLVTEWVRERIETNDALRETVVEAVRDAAELPPCPPVCDGSEPEPCCVEGKAEVVDEIL